jgi:hypothetical protein
MSSKIYFADDVFFQILEDEGVMFSASRQELYIFNTAASFIWACLEENMTFEEIAAAYERSFDVPTSNNIVRSLLGQWQGLGYIAGDGIPRGDEIDFTTAVARLLTNPLLRNDFALARDKVALEIAVRESDLECFLSLRSEDLEHEAERIRLKNRERRLGRRGQQHGNLNVFAARDFFGGMNDVAVGVRPSSFPKRYYELLTLKFALRLNSVVQETTVLPALRHLEIVEPTGVDMDIHVLETSGGFLLLDGFAPIGFCSRLDELLPIIKAALRMRIADTHEYLFQIHAGVISNGEKCILFPGEPGSGKTTLTAGLAASGFFYFSDEVALLEDQDMVVRPVPLSLAVKDGACKELAPYYPDLWNTPVHHREDRRTVRYIGPPPNSMWRPADQAQKIGWIIFPRYVAHAETQLKPIRKGEALRRLMQECVVIPELLSRETVQHLVQLMRTVDCYELTMSSLSPAIHVIKDLCVSSKLH